MIFRNSADLPRTALRARSHTFLQFTLHPNRLSTGLQGTSARAMVCRKITNLPPTDHTRPCRHCIPLSCNPSDKAIAFLRASRAHPLAQWHQFVSIERPKPLQTALQGTSTRAMVCRKITDLPHTAVQALHSPFLQFIWHGNRHSTGLQGTLTRAMASICVHRATRTLPDSTPGHIRSRDGLQEEPQPATHSRAGPASPFPAINLARQSPFYGPPRHIRSRDGLQEDHRPATDRQHTALRARLVHG